MQSAQMLVDVRNKLVIHSAFLVEYIYIYICIFIYLFSIETSMTYDLDISDIQRGTFTFDLTGGLLTLVHFDLTV